MDKQKGASLQGCGSNLIGECVFEPTGWQRNLLICLSELVCSHKTSRNEPSGVQAGLSSHSWWPVRGRQKEWDTRLVSPGGRMRGWEEHSMRGLWETLLGKGVVQIIRELVPAGSLEHRMSMWRGQQQKVITSSCWSGRVPEGQCLLGEWLGPSTRCPHTHTTDPPETSGEPLPPAVFPQHSLLRKLNILDT